MKKNIYPTIVAIATPISKSAIHIIRLSGSNAYSIINKVVNKKISKESYKIQRANIVDDKNEVIDDVLLMKFVSPKSFTGEDMVEINCHGGIYLANKIVGLLLNNGAKYAKPGEFTQRALFNNKINLINAESINNLINANNDFSIKIAMNGINDNLKNEITNINKKLFLLIGQIEINIDYPEYIDEAEITNKKLKEILEKIVIKNDLLIEKSKQLSKINDGFKIAIVGQPNVGKSSLLNNILNENKAIVSNIPGTTRDVVEGQVNFNGKTFIFLDTAGIRKGKNKIEKIGISKTKTICKNADLVLFVLDNNKKFNKEDEIILKIIKNKKHIIVLNKSDLKSNNSQKGYKFSAKTDDSINILKIIDNSLLDDRNIKNDYIVLQNSRQIDTFMKANNILKFVLTEATKRKNIDYLVEFLHQAYDLINEIICKNNDSNFIDKLFENFCLGK